LNRRHGDPDTAVDHDLFANTSCENQHDCAAPGGKELNETSDGCIGKDIEYLGCR
jgi:hypothetical protein